MFDQRKTVKQWEMWEEEMGYTLEKKLGRKKGKIITIPESERSLRPEWKAKET